MDPSLVINSRHRVVAFLIFTVTAHVNRWMKRIIPMDHDVDTEEVEPEWATAVAQLCPSEPDIAVAIT